MLLTSHQANVNPSVSQIAGNVNRRHRYKTDTRIFKILQNNFAQFLLHQLLHAFHAQLSHRQLPFSVFPVVRFFPALCRPGVRFGDRSRNFFHAVNFENIPFLEISVILNGQPALVTRRHFLHIVFEAA